MVEIEKVFTVGLDPGMSTGLAVYDRRSKQIVKIATMDFWGCYDYLRVKPVSRIIIVIETPVKNAMYARQQDAADQGSAKRGNRMMANAASNAREAELLADGLEKLGFEVRRQRPKRRNFKTAAEDVEYVQNLTGYLERTNAHTRDAICLCWGI